MSTHITTYQFRIKDATSRKHLERMASAVNFVWNYCNEISMFALNRDKRFLTGYDLNGLTRGVAKDLGLHSQTVQSACEEYATCRRQQKKRRLAWRSKKRSLGWVPFKASGVRVQDDTVTYCGQTFRFWSSRPIEGRVKTGSFSQDARKRWYVNFQYEIEGQETGAAGLDLGIDLGLQDVAACSDGITYSRANVTRLYADELARA